MFKNYLKIAFRNLKRDKIYSFINIFGLAIGLACCLLILLYIFDELSYDSFNEKADRIFRVNTEIKFGSTELAIPVCSDMLGPMMKKDYPQVKEYTRIYAYGGTKLVRTAGLMNTNFNNEQGFAYADSTFFKVFTFPAVEGNTTHILNEPNTVVITESIAKKYFGSPDAVGKLLETNDNGSTVYKVTAVIKDMPGNSHFRFNFIFPMYNLDYDWGNYVSSNFRTYLLLKEGVNYKEFEKYFIDYGDRYEFPYAKKFLQIQSKEEFFKAGNKLEHSLIPLRDIHLYSKRAQEISPTGTIEYVYIFSAIALFILIIACVNFMNLTTARSANRAREVGIRKVLGTERKSLIMQFLFESALMSAIAVLLAVAIVCAVLPFFNNVAGKELTLSNMISLPVLSLIVLLPLIIGITAGSYPAFFLSRFMPAQIIKGKLSGGSKSGMLRSALVVFQFVTSIILITGTIVIYKQLNYIQNKNLGYQKDQVLIINDAYTLGNNVDAFKNEMLRVPGVTAGTVSNFLPVPSERNFSAFFKELSLVSKSGMTMQRWKIDYDYLKTLGIKILEGRNFSTEFGSDSSSIILNEAAVKQLGYINPVGQMIYTWVGGGRVKSYNIIGVVKNFHFESMHQEIGSLCFVLEKSTGLCSFRVNPTNIPIIIQRAGVLWKSMAPGMPFSYRFMDDSFNEIYKAEQRVGTIALSFSLLAIIVACLGLFGLATFLAEQRTKEIGVRKVLGASIASLLFMLSKEFLKWIIIANVIACPVSYYFMNKWLQDFAYRIQISWWVFLLAGVIAIVIALTTVSFRAVKASTANPVESLRYE